MLVEIYVGYISISTCHFTQSGICFQSTVSFLDACNNSHPSNVARQDSSGGTTLNSGYTFFYMRRGKSKEEEGTSNPYESAIKSIATVKTVEGFWETYDYLVRPNDLPSATDYHFFREGIKPTWEDPSNSRGGKWIVRLRKGLSSRYWEEGKLAVASLYIARAFKSADLISFIIAISVACPDWRSVSGSSRGRDLRCCG